MKPILYLYRSFTSCRNAVAILEAHGVEFEAREFFKEPYSREEMTWVLCRAGMKPSDLVSKRSAPYRNGNLAEREVSEDEWMELMLAEPRLIRRPLLVTDEAVQVGFNRSRMEEIAGILASRSEDASSE